MSTKPGCHWDSVSLRDAGGKFAQTHGVRVVLGQHGVVLVHPVHGFLYVCGHLGVGQGQGLHGLRSAAYGLFQIELSGYRCGPNQYHQ